MKKNTAIFCIAVILISLLIIKTSCKDKTPEGYSEKPPAKRTFFDTTRVIGVFVTPERNNIVHDIAYKVRFDSTETLVESGKGIFIKLWHTDSVYFLPKVVPLLDSITKKPILGTDGVQKFKTDWVGPYKNDIIWDTGINVDSAQSRFKKFLILDTATKK